MSWSFTSTVGVNSGSLEDCILGRISCGIKLKHRHYISKMLRQRFRSLKDLSKLSKLEMSRIMLHPLPEEEGIRPQMDEVTSLISYFCGYDFVCRDLPEHKLARLKVIIQIGMISVQYINSSQISWPWTTWKSTLLSLEFSKRWKNR